MAVKDSVRWGIIGPGGIARDFLAGAQGSLTGEIVAIGTRRPDNPDLSRDFPGIRIVAGGEALIRDPEVDAVYVATPHPMHAEWAIAAAKAGRHVLCEKPMGMTLGETEAMFAAAEAAGVLMAEAFMYRHHPLIQAILDLVGSGAIGDIRLIRSSFGFAVPQADPGHRLFARALGGGAILDVGGYPASMCRLIAGVGTSEGVAEPVNVVAQGRFGETGVDDVAAATLTFPNNVIAQLSCSIVAWQDNVLHVMGTEGRLEVDDFWFGGGKSGGTAVIRHYDNQGRRTDHGVSDPRNLYSFQFEATNRAILAGHSELAFPAMSRADSIGNARLLDSWLAAIGAAPY